MRSGIKWIAGCLLFLGTASVAVGLLNLRQNELSAARHANMPLIPITSTFTDQDGESHVVETRRGQLDPEETEVEHVIRHLREFRNLKEAVKNARK